MLVSLPHSLLPRSEYFDEPIRVSADGSAPRVRWPARADQDRESAAGGGIASTEVCGDTGVTLSPRLEYFDEPIRVSAEGSGSAAGARDRRSGSAAGFGIALTEVCGHTGVPESDTLEHALCLEHRTMPPHARRPTDAMNAMVATSATDATTSPRICGVSPPPRPCGGGSGGSAGGGGSDVGDGGGSGGGGGAVTMGTTARLMEIGAADVTATPSLAVMALARLATSAMADVLTAAAVASAAAAESGMVRTAVTRREPAGTRSTITHSGS